MMEAKNVLYLSYDGLTDVLGQSQILPYVTGLAKSGYAYTIISFEKADKFDLHEATLRAICNQYSIEWIPLPYHRKPPVVSTVYDLIKLRTTCKELHQRKPIAIVHCRSYITSLIGMWLKKKFGIRFIFDMRGFWADERVDGGLWSLKNPLFKTIYSFFKKKEKQFLESADAVIVLTEAAKAEIQSWGIRTPITTIPCCVDLEMFDAKRFSNDTKTKLRSKLGIAADDFVLLYLGSVGTWYQWDAMVSFFEKVKEQRKNAKFLVLTPDQDKVVRRDDFMVRSVPRSEVPAHISISDASVCFITPQFSKKGSSATKMAEVLAMNIPVITNRGWGDIEYLQSRVNNLFVTSDHGDANEVRQVLSHNPTGQTEFFANFFALKEGVARYRDVYNELIFNTR